MIEPKEIQCPICGTVLSKMGGGVAGHWGLDKCKNCGSWVDFDSETLAHKEDIPTTGLPEESSTSNTVFAHPVGVDDAARLVSKVRDLLQRYRDT